MSEAHGSVRVNVGAGVVGSSVTESVGHGRQDGRINDFSGAVDTCYAAHFISGSFSRAPVFTMSRVAPDVSGIIRPLLISKGVYGI